MVLQKVGAFCLDTVRSGELKRKHLAFLQIKLEPFSNLHPVSTVFIKLDNKWWPIPLSAGCEICLEKKVSWSARR